MITIVFGNQPRSNVVDLVRSELSKDDQKRVIWIAAWEAVVGANVSLYEEREISIWKVERINP